MSDVRDRLLQEAQHQIQTVGYNGFSFRDLANKVGIKSASIHYHFPTKADLGQAIAAQYAETFMTRLREESEREGDPGKLLMFYASLFREALEDDSKMCLCGMLSAEATSLPANVISEATAFFEANLVWLTRVFEAIGSDKGDVGTSSPRTEAETLMASLQGALVMSRGLGDAEVFDRIAGAALKR